MDYKTTSNLNTIKSRNYSNKNNTCSLINSKKHKIKDINQDISSEKNSKSKSMKNIISFDNKNNIEVSDITKEDNIETTESKKNRNKTNKVVFKRVYKDNNNDNTDKKSINTEELKNDIRINDERSNFDKMKNINENNYLKKSLLRLNTTYFSNFFSNMISKKDADTKTKMMNQNSSSYINSNIPIFTKIKNNRLNSTNLNNQDNNYKLNSFKQSSILNINKRASLNNNIKNFKCDSKHNRTTSLFLNPSCFNNFSNHKNNNINGNLNNKIEGYSGSSKIKLIKQEFFLDDIPHKNKKLDKPQSTFIQKICDYGYFQISPIGLLSDKIQSRQELENDIDINCLKNDEEKKNLMSLLYDNNNKKLRKLMKNKSNKPYSMNYNSLKASQNKNEKYPNIHNRLNSTDLCHNQIKVDNNNINESRSVHKLSNNSSFSNLLSEENEISNKIIFKKEISFDGEDEVNFDYDIKGFILPSEVIKNRKRLFKNLKKETNFFPGYKEKIEYYDVIRHKFNSVKINTTNIGKGANLY